MCFDDPTDFAADKEDYERWEANDMTDDLFNFDLDVPDGEPETAPTAAITEVEKWAKEQLADKPAASSDAIPFDIETGPLPEEQLRQLFHEKTLDEFAATCHRRWKRDTVALKYQEYKVKAFDEFVGKAALSAIAGRVLLIGLLWQENFTPIGNDESAILEQWWETVDSAIANKQRMIGHNSNGFDLPFLVRRSWLLGVPVPREVRQGRYFNPLFQDTMEVWNCGSRDYISLNELGAAFGVGQKTEGIAGADFAKYWFGAPEERELAIRYNEQDVRLTAAVAEKMGLM